MKTFQGRAAEPKDAQNYMDWLKAASDRNLVSLECYAYPTCNTFVVDADNEPVLMNSVHLVLQMEALAPKPGLEPKDEARALRELYRCVRNLAKFSGVAEVFFTCNDPSLEKFILKKGFKKVETAVYKMVVDGKDDPLNSESISEAKAAVRA